MPRILGGNATRKKNANVYYYHQCHDCKITIKEKTNNKGEVGQLVEKYLFGIENNNASEPEFMPAGIELKVTAYKKIRKGKESYQPRIDWFLM